MTATATDTDTDLRWVDIPFRVSIGVTDDREAYGIQRVVLSPHDEELTRHPLLANPVGARIEFQVDIAADPDSAMIFKQGSIVNVTFSTEE